MMFACADDRADSSSRKSTPAAMAAKQEIRLTWEPAALGTARSRAFTILPPQEYLNVGKVPGPKHPVLSALGRRVVGDLYLHLSLYLYLHLIYAPEYPSRDKMLPAHFCTDWAWVSVDFSRHPSTAPLPMKRPLAEAFTGFFFSWSRILCTELLATAR